MTRYIALVDGSAGAYGATFPDLPGCTAMGGTVDEALRNATEALRDWVEVTEARGGAVPPPTPAEVLIFDRAHVDFKDQAAGLAYVPLVRNAGRPVKANLSLDSGVLAAIDAAAEARGVTRSALVEELARRGLSELA